MQRLRDRGQLVVSLRAADGPRAAPLRQVLQRAFRRLGGRVRLATLVLFTGQLAAMLEAGLHLVRILTALARESSDRRFAKIVEDVRDSLEAGLQHRSEEHTSELQSRQYLVCRLLLEKKKKETIKTT